MKKIVSVLILMLCGLFLLSGCRKEQEKDKSDVSINLDELKMTIERETNGSFGVADPYFNIPSDDDFQMLFMEDKDDHNQFLLVILHPSQSQIIFVNDYAEICQSRSDDMNYEARFWIRDEYLYLIFAREYAETLEEIIANSVIIPL